MFVQKFATSVSILTDCMEDVLIRLKMPQTGMEIDLHLHL